MPEPRSALHEVLSDLIVDLYLLRELYKPLILDAKLPEPALAPPPYVPFAGDRETKEGPTGYVVHGFPVECLDVVGGARDLGALRDAQLALEATAPGVDVGFIGQNEGVVLSAGDLDDTLVSQGLQDRGGELCARAAVA